MPQPRKSQISLIDTPYYHCVSRCVRRSFLCGEDKFTGQSHEYRRGQVEEQLLFFLLYLHLIYMLCGDDQSYSSEINWTARIKR